MKLEKIKRLLIANRGEIAVRIIKAAKELGIYTVAIYSADDSESLHVTMADVAVLLGNGNLKETYLNQSKLFDIAQKYKCDAIHPGYGFLSENPEFVEACEKRGFLFVGPKAQSVKLMGDKVAARKLAQSIGLPVIKGYEASYSELMQLPDTAYPLIVKPTLGGGGKGMHIILSKDMLKENLERAQRESDSFFANNKVYFEKYIEKARHIEVQILGDAYGNHIHLYERECSIQRNFQKIIEEAPSAYISASLREQLTEAAVKIAKASGYVNAGTVEFLIDNDEWYFIEMNTRIQVEHPVTELVTGIDLVKWQLKITNGDPLTISQDDIALNGYAIELRLNAESPYLGFEPSAGELSLFIMPANARVDTFIAKNIRVSSNYDSLLSKIIVHGVNRDEAIAKAIESLNKTHIHGIETNKSFLFSILNSKEYNENNVYTRFCNTFLSDYASLRKEAGIDNRKKRWVIGGYIFINYILKKNNPTTIWEKIGYWRILSNVRFKLNGQIINVSFYKSGNHWLFKTDDSEFNMTFSYIPNILTIDDGNSIENIFYSNGTGNQLFIEIAGEIFKPEPISVVKELRKNENNFSSESGRNWAIISPMHGRVVKINVSEQEKINRGDVLLVIEAMKTENHILAPGDGIVKAIHVEEGLQVHDKLVLLEIE